ncbi:MAG: aminotransferase class III-fold pyridoxal phosphate-dependent enzyme [Actinobacteria bacterium]|nr:aminotransferase class III-fold pyridoxal phosphate-dependent enzyme [Actinomycetota bacterium]
MSHEELLARHRNVLPDWLALYYEQPISLERGEGRHVWDAGGNRYLDFFAGILTTMSGHAVPEIVDTIKNQADKMLHSSTLYLIEPAIELAERIAELAPVDDGKVFFTSSGSEANETALLLAAAYRRSNQVLALRNSYHGRSFATVAITGNRGWSPSALTPVNVSYVHGGYRLRSPWSGHSDAAYIGECVYDLRSVIDTMTSGDVACLIAEPIQGVGGFATPPDGLFGAMHKVLDEHGILLISDEVQTGWGRTGGHFWGIDAHGVRPDMITFAKGLGNGLSIGGVVARAEIMDCLQANSISTFGGNPLSTAGALANLDYLLDNDLQANCLKRGEQLMGRIRAAVDGRDYVAEVRGKGLMLGVELVRPGGLEPSPEAASWMLEETRRNGLLVGKGGLYGNVLRIAPPMSLTEDEAEEGGDILGQAIRSYDPV